MIQNISHYQHDFHVSYKKYDQNYENEFMPRQQKNQTCYPKNTYDLYQHKKLPKSPTESTNHMKSSLKLTKLVNRYKTLKNIYLNHENNLMSKTIKTSKI